MSVPNADSKVVHLPGKDASGEGGAVDSPKDSSQIWQLIHWVDKKFGRAEAVVVTLVAAVAFGVTGGGDVAKHLLKWDEMVTQASGVEEASADAWVDVMAGVGSASTLQPYQVGVNASGVLSRSAAPMECRIIVRHRDFFGKDSGSAQMEIHFPIRTYSAEDSKLDIFFNPHTAQKLRLDPRHPTRMQVRWECPDAA